MRELTNLIRVDVPNRADVTSVTAFRSRRSRRWFERFKGAAKRRKNVAHGASRGWGPTRGTEPRRGERQMSHTSGNILLHFIFIFSTQGRRPMIKPDFRRIYSPTSEALSANPSLVSKISGFMC